MNTHKFRVAVTPKLPHSPGFIGKQGNCDPITRLQGIHIRHAYL